MCAAFRQPRPVGLAVEDLSLVGPGGLIAARRYWPKDPASARVVYFHGGGFVVGGLDSHDDVCAEIAVKARVELVAVDYRLCPEHPHPAAFADAMAAVDALADQALIVAGDSAGGNLAAAVAIHTSAPLKGQVLIYPGLGGEALDLAAYTQHRDAPLLATTDVQAYRSLREAGPGDADRPDFSPLLARDFGRAPPCFVSAAEFDPLRDDGVAFAERLDAAGVAGEVVIEGQLPHGFLRARHMSKRAAGAFDRICAAISKFSNLD